MSLNFSWRFVKKYAKVIVAVVVAVAITYFTLGAGGSLAGTLVNKVIVGAAAGGASGLILTGSLKGALEGAFFGAVTAGFAAYVGGSAASQINSLGTGVLKSSAQQALTRSIQFAARVKLVVGHAIIGGLRSVYNGGKFLQGVLSAGLGKLSTFATNAFVNVNRISDRLVQGLVVATAGGAVAALVGGSFELGFFTAGLAFAVNEILSSGSSSCHPKLRGGQCGGFGGTRQRLAEKYDVRADPTKVGFSGSVQYPPAALGATLLNNHTGSLIPTGLSAGAWVDSDGTITAAPSVEYNSGIGTIFTGTLDILQPGSNPDAEVSLFLGLGAKAYFEGSDFVGYGVGVGLGTSFIHRFFFGNTPVNLEVSGSQEVGEVEF